MSLPSSADFIKPAISSVPRKPLRGRWVWGAGIFTIACLAQAILWTMWWENPTHFKMSILFVWPAALFALTIWWVFFSGWSWLIRLGSMGTVATLIVVFLSAYRLEWDGDMVPRRIVLRSKPTGDEIARKYRKEHSVASSTVAQEEVADSPVVISPPLKVTEGDWPGFRGPHRDGVVRGVSIRHDWEQRPLREVWRHPVGRGWSSFAVIGNIAFTQEQRDERECVVAYDLNTGTELWEYGKKGILAIVDVNGGPGPHATPQFDDGLLYTLGGIGFLNCLDAATGKIVWSREILRDAGDGKVDAPNIPWGMSGSPLIVDNLVVVIPGGTKTEGALAYNKGVAAYDKKTGDPVWTVGTHQASYASPCVAAIAGTRQLLIAHGEGLSGQSLEDGTELWFFPLKNDPQVNSANPWTLQDESILFGTGYGIGTARLDVKNDAGQWTVSKRWFSNRYRPKFNDFVVLDGYLYGLDDGTLTCVDVENGAIKWKSGRYGYGQLLLVDNVLLMISEDGELLLIPATPTKPEKLANMPLLRSGFCWNHLALAHGKLLVRNAVEAVCLELDD